MLVAEGEVVVYEVAGGLRPRPAERRMSEEAPSVIGKAIGLTVAAAKQEQQGFRREVLDLVLQRVQVDRIGRARITNNGVSAEGEMAGRCNQAAAPVSKTVAIAFHWDRRLCHQTIWTLKIGETREVHVERYDHRHRLWKVEAEFAPDVDTHDVSISRFGGARSDEEFFGIVGGKGSPRAVRAALILGEGSAAGCTERPSLTLRVPFCAGLDYCAGF